MQMLPSYRFCVKFLLFVIVVRAQNEIVTSSWSTTDNSGTTIISSTESSFTNDPHSNETTVHPENVILKSINQNLNNSTSNDVDSTTRESFTIPYLTTAEFVNDDNLTTTTDSAAANTTTSAPNLSTTTENLVTTTSKVTDVSTTENSIPTTSLIRSTTENRTTDSTAANTTTSSPNLSTTTENLVTTTSKVTDVSTTENSIPTTSLIPSTTENITTTTDIPIVTTTEEQCISPKSINLTVTKIFKTGVDIRLRLEIISNKTICATQITINCEATNITWWWVVPSQNVTLELNDTKPHDITLRNLSEFTNYNCTVKTDDIVYLNFTFTTKQEVPNSPTHLAITILNATSFNITWEEPDKIPSHLLRYALTIIRGDVASEGHFYTCSDNVSFPINTTKNSYLFDQALPDFFYNVTVKAVSNVGFGEAISNATITPIRAPGPPENVNFTLPETGESDKNIIITFHLTWDMGCNTDGPVSHFQVKLDRDYNETRPDVRNASVVLYQNQSTSYSCDFVDVWAASTYKFDIRLVGNNMEGFVYADNFSTRDNYPNAPDLQTEISATNLILTWTEPTNYPGEIKNYQIYIIEDSWNWNKTASCNISAPLTNITETVHAMSFYTEGLVPDANYYVSIAAITSRGRGNSTQVTVTSKMSTPDLFLILTNISSKPNTENYDDNVTIKIEPGCFNGKFDSYEVSYDAERNEYPDDSNITTITNYEVTELTISLKPEYMYTVRVTVNNKQYNTVIYTNVTAPAGVPFFDTSVIGSIPITTEDTQTTLTLTRDLFDESQGILNYIAVLLSNENVTGGSFSSWNNMSQWPAPEGNATVYYQASPKYWCPFATSDTTEFVIGTDTSCSEKQYCNKPLEPDTQYYVFLRLFNNNYYRNTMPMSFVTKSESKLALILGLTFGILTMAVMGFVVVILWRKGYIRYPRPSEPKNTGTDIPIIKFVSYCKYLEQNPDVLKAQWLELDRQSKIIYSELPNHFAILPENKRKNRYTNILPFDHSRVKLNIDEDDEIGSDYINASYIPGFSTENEYIATQGPKQETCKDFWKMILQERVSIIVMVSRFIENNRDKCYQYFPNNREMMTVAGDDIEIRCSTELHFGFYCIRTLQVKKELKQTTVTHLQFLEWPDFGVPEGTESMLHFCHQLQERWTSEGGIAVVHCSAGVGRTGTIIATDILLRALKAGKKLDVFNTVLDLRRHRNNMVQTEIQYMYIYQLIRNMIEFPIIDDPDNQEHVYENLEIRNKNRIVESTL